jgi:hypothetical protein
MRTSKNGMLMVITLIGVVTFTGNAAALVEPVSGQVSAIDAQGQIVALWVETNQADYVTTTILEGGPGNPDRYDYPDIQKLLSRNGVAAQGTYNLAVAMFCSGYERDIDGNVGPAYTNTYHNDTGVIGGPFVFDGSPKYMSILNSGSCTVTAEETFSKTLYEGWNLISLPLDPAEDGIASAVLSTVSYNAVYQYNATSKHFESIESTDVMNPGTGYFVHATADCIWKYNGTANTSMDVLLEPGLTMVGWLNCSKGIDDALSSISGDYYYVARWNTSAQKFEVFNPAAPTMFNDFTAMDQGTGYFISAKQDCAISESC